MSTIPHKPCHRCDVEKPLDEFGSSAHSEDGRRTLCKDCNRLTRIKYNKINRDNLLQYSREYSKANRDKEIQRGCRYRISIDGRVNTMLYNARKRKPKDFSVTSKHIAEQLNKGYCAMTNVPFDMRTKVNGKRNPFAPSLDRIDSSKGYTNENTRVVILWYNLAKSHWTDDELSTIIRIVMKHDSCNLFFDNTT